MPVWVLPGSIGIFEVPLRATKLHFANPFANDSYVSLAVLREVPLCGNENLVRI